MTDKHEALLKRARRYAESIRDKSTKELGITIADDQAIEISRCLIGLNEAAKRLIDEKAELERSLKCWSKTAMNYRELYHSTCVVIFEQKAKADALDKALERLSNPELLDTDFINGKWRKNELPEAQLTARIEFARAAREDK